MKKPKLKTVIVDGVEMKDYLVSETGEVYRLHQDAKRTLSRLTRLKKQGRNHLVTFNKKKRYVKLLKPSYTRSGYRRVLIIFPANSFVYKYHTKNENENREHRHVLMHQVVMQTFKPFDKFLPKEINKEDYDKTPESMKIFIRQAFIINHIDHDKQNNNVTNLEWVTTKANNHKAVKHYGGNCANANKKEEV